MKRLTLLFTLAVCLASGNLIGTSAAAVTQRSDGLVLCSAGDTFTLPTAANKPGRVYRVKNTGTAVCTVATTSAQTIDGISTRSVPPGQTLILTSDAGNWVSSQSAATTAALGSLTTSYVNDEATTVPANYLMRLNGTAAGHAVKAQADTAAHSAGILGVTSASVAASGTVSLLPLTGWQTIAFDAAPTVGGFAFVSTSTSGKASNTIPYTSVVAVPLGSVVADVSVGVAYAAVVNCSLVGQFTSGSLEDSLHAETVAYMGGEPGRWDTRWDHFNKLPGASRIPQWGNVSYATTPDNPSCVKMGPKDGHTASWYFLGSQAEMFLTSKLVESIKGRFSALVQFDAAARVASFVFGGTNDTIYIGVIDGSTIEVVIVNDGGSTWASGTPSAGQRQTLGTVVGGTKAQIDLFLWGDGTFSARGPSGVMTAPRSLGNASWAYSNFSWANANNGGAVELDWVFSDIYR